MFRDKLPQHSRDAIIDAIAILTTLKEAQPLLQEHTISHLRAIIGLRGEKIEDHMNKAIAEGVENEKKDVA